MTHARSLFGFGRAEEITVECNPDDLTGEYVARLRDTEIDRVSVGVQSFDDACLRMMNRRHTAADAVGAVRRLRRAGFANLTVDLIYGVPGFGGESLRRSLGMALSLEAEHLSAFFDDRTRHGARKADGRGPLRAGGRGDERTRIRLRARHADRRGVRALRGANFCAPPGAARGTTPPTGRANLTSESVPAPIRSTGPTPWCEPGVAEYIAGPATGASAAHGARPGQRDRDDGRCARPTGSTREGFRRALRRRTPCADDGRGAAFPEVGGAVFWRAAGCAFRGAVSAPDAVIAALSMREDASGCGKLGFSEKGYLCTCRLANSNQKIHSMSNAQLAPDYLFEVSWEVCNKIGGIHTVVSTRPGHDPPLRQTATS